MQAFAIQCAAALAASANTALALNGIVAPSRVEAGSEFPITFEKADDDHDYRIYLAAALSGADGPTCYLVNSTTLSHSTTNLTVPAAVGPAADYYSIGIADLTTAQGATYSNRFNLTGAEGEYSPYENSLRGSPFWSADRLPCDAYSCARECATAVDPDDLRHVAAYDDMTECILRCDGVAPPPPSPTAPPAQSTPAAATAASSGPADAASSTASRSPSTSSAAAHAPRVYAAGAAAGFAALASFPLLLP